MLHIYIYIYIYDISRLRVKIVYFPCLAADINSTQRNVSSAQQHRHLSKRKTEGTNGVGGGGMRLLTANKTKKGVYLSTTEQLDER